MSDKTEELYKLVIDKVISSARELSENNFNVQLAISDFEQAILSTMEEAFPASRARGCWFHFGQVMIFTVQFEFFIYFLFVN